MEDEVIVVFITASSFEEARNIASTLVESRIAACASILKGVSSLYWWKGGVEFSEETLIIVKTRSSLLKELVEKVRSSHSYEVPEIIAVRVVGGLEEYLEWVKRETRTQ